ncbi:MAG: hypothetical protein Q8936_06620 [Bacillota bacterium]|nr:hypothetical protein [Bacillota bacterium]
MALDMVNVAKEIYEAAHRLRKSSDILFSLAKEYAETEQIYRQALAKEKVKLREAGMTVSLIDDVAKGNTAKLKYDRDLAEFKFTAGKEKARALQCEISALQSIYRRQDEI